MAVSETTALHFPPELDYFFQLFGVIQVRSETMITPTQFTE